MENTQKGFTVIEMMISVGISTIIVAGVFGILHASNKQLEIIDARMTLQEGPREALFKMAQEIRQTAWHKIAAFEVPNKDGVEILAVPDAKGVVSAPSINFVVPVPNPDPNYLVDNNYSPKWADNIEYKLDGVTHQILRIATDLTTQATKEAVLANEITSLEFSKKASSPGLLTITLGAQRELADGRKIPDEPIEMIAQAEARNP